MLAHNKKEKKERKKHNDNYKSISQSLSLKAHRDSANTTFHGNEFYVAIIRLQKKCLHVS